eukprot:170955_1
MSKEALDSKYKQLLAKYKDLEHKYNKVKKERDKYRGLLHLDEIEQMDNQDDDEDDVLDDDEDDRSNWCLLWQFFMNRWDDLNKLYKDDDLRLEFDYDQYYNRLNRMNGIQTSNKWGRGSHMFFSQVALHTGLYKQLKIMGFLEMPHQNTIRI